MPKMRRKGTGLGEAIYYALTGKSPRSAERMSAREKVNEMLQRHRTPRRIAEMLGVSKRTVEKWRAGKQKPSPENAKKLDDAQRAARMSPGKAKLFGGASSSPEFKKAGPSGLTIKGSVRVSEDVRDRVIEVGKFMPPGALESVVQAFEQNGSDAAAAELTALIQYYYNVPDMQVESVEWIDYE